MKTSQASFRQKNPQVIINSLLAYLCTHDSYYPWYQYIANTYDNSITGYVPIPNQENPFEYLEHIIREEPNTNEILVYYNTDDEFFSFHRLQDEPLADIQYAESTHACHKTFGITFYLFED